MKLTILISILSCSVLAIAQEGSEFAESGETSAAVNQDGPKVFAGPPTFDQCKAIAGANSLTLPENHFTAMPIERFGGDDGDITQEKRDKIQKSEKMFRIGVYKTGNREDFLRSCAANGVQARYCHQMTHPNNKSEMEFRCTYPSARTHVLIPPDPKTWDYGFRGALEVQKIEATGVCVAEIYNYYRPEPYNNNVEGAPGRHPYGTAIDVEFCTKEDARKAVRAFCKQRTPGDSPGIKSVGTYASGIRVHLGMRPEPGGHWGNGC